MGLKNTRFQEDYRSGYDNIVEDFFRPCLREAQHYWRAVGYFSSSALEAFGAPLGEFIKNGGSIRLVTSVELSEADLETIEAGVAKQDVCAQRIEQIVRDDFAEGVGDGVARLARLLELGRLEIQIAVPRTGTGIYHEKIGLFFDGDDFVAFTGSSNESWNAFQNNRECVDVYPSWSSSTRAERKKAHFEAVWNRVDKGVDVYGFPEAAKKKILRVCRQRQMKPVQGEGENGKWYHQDEAVSTFLKAERGVLNMATGTGKTRTALKILKALYDSKDIESAIICTDGINLLDQWYRDIIKIREKVTPELKVFRHYDVNKQAQNFVVDPRDSILLVSREPVALAMHGLHTAQARKTLLIHDEVHGLGSPGNRDRLTGLSDAFRFRLGLSATPDRKYDEEGNDFITKHIGPVIVNFGLEEAIRRGVLAPFNYFPLSFELTVADRERIANIYKKRKAREIAGDPMSEIDVRIEIANVYKTSVAKLPTFKDFIENNTALLERCIVFAHTKKFALNILEIIHRHRPDFHTYFSGEDAETLTKFANRELECLIACHRLSEGIDIQSLNTVVLFSSEGTRLETIQRIGRCLRTDPDNPNKIANIVDFIRKGNECEEPNVDEERQNWLNGLSKIYPGNENGS